MYDKNIYNRSTDAPDRLQISDNIYYDASLQTLISGNTPITFNQFERNRDEKTVLSAYERIDKVFGMPKPEVLEIIYPIILFNRSLLDKEITPDLEMMDRRRFIKL